MALASSVLALAAQALTVTFNYQGNWTALFHHGSAFTLPEAVAAEGAYVFPESTGYDGQLYHLIAHDPFLLKGYVRFVDNPRLRYRRILVPALAHMLSLGAPAAVHVTYIALILFSVGLGAYWLGLWSTSVGRSPLWGLLFLALPATFVSVEYLLPDVALAALTVAFVRHSTPRPSPALFVIVLLAPLVRETGLLLWLAVLLALASRPLRWGPLLRFSAAVIPALAWYGYVAFHTTASPYPASFVPLEAAARAFLAPDTGPPPLPSGPGVGMVRALWRAAAPFVVAALTRLALVGAVLALGLGLLRLCRKAALPELAAALFALLALFLQRPENWINVCDYGRVYSPLLIVLLMRSLEERRRVGLLPLALILPSLVQQTSAQAVGIVRGILR